MTRLLVLALGLFASVGVVGSDIKPVITPAWHQFDLRDVRLLEGPFKAAMERNCEYLLSLEPDRFLAWVRKNAGLEPKAPVYGGWESEGVAGQSLGHYLTALAQQYRATDDQRFLERLNYIVAELALCQAEDPSGLVCAIPDAKEAFGGLKQRGGRMTGWVPWYTMHKMFQGLRDAYLLAGNEQAKGVLIKLTDWTDATTRDLTGEEMEVMLGTEHGGMPETLADVYAITGNPRDLQLARRFSHRFVMDPLSRGEDRLNGLHANTQVPKITGAARIYELTGEPYFHDVARNFWWFVVTNRSYALGGNSDSEHFFPPEDCRRHLTSATAETCNTYNMLKLTEHLAAWQPDGKWMDYYERALYNHILASQDPETGMFTYFVSMKPGHFKTYSNPTNAFWCCVGSGMENHTKYGQVIYTHSQDTLWVNLFIASELTWKDKGLVVRQETEFPERDTTRLTIRTDHSQRLALKIRSPFWLKEPLSIRVNGKAVRAKVESGYATVERKWREGDKVEVTLPMNLRTEPLSHAADIRSFFYGPILLAAELGRKGMESLILYQDNHNENLFRNVPVPVTPVIVSATPAAVLDHLQPVPGRPLNFRTRDLVQPEDVTLIPFWRVHHQRYSVFFETFTPDDWKRRKADLQAAGERQKAFEARIVDEVRPGEQQSEIDHAFKGEKTGSGGGGPKWRDAADGGWFEYQLRVPSGPAELLANYWGSDTGRNFDVLVDGQKLGTEHLNNSRPGEMITQHYPIPAGLKQGKERVTVRFQPHPGSTAGGVFGVRLMRAEQGNKP